MPLYFYAGFNYFDPKKIGGIYQNLLDEHPLQDPFTGSPVQERARPPKPCTMGL